MLWQYEILYVSDSCHTSSEDIRPFGLMDLLVHLILGGENIENCVPKSFKYQSFMKEISSFLPLLFFSTHRENTLVHKLQGPLADK